MKRTLKIDLILYAQVTIIMQKAVWQCDSENLKRHGCMSQKTLYSCRLAVVCCK